MRPAFVLHPTYTLELLHGVDVENEMAKDNNNSISITTRTMIKREDKHKT